MWQLGTNPLLILLLSWWKKIAWIWTIMIEQKCVILLATTVCIFWEQFFEPWILSASAVFVALFLFLWKKIKNTKKKEKDEKCRRAENSWLKKLLSKGKHDSTSYSVLSNTHQSNYTLRNMLFSHCFIFVKSFCSYMRILTSWSYIICSYMHGAAYIIMPSAF